MRLVNTNKEWEDRPTEEFKDAIRKSFEEGIPENKENKENININVKSNNNNSIPQIRKTQQVEEIDVNAITKRLLGK